MTNIVQHANVGMIQAGDGFRFAFEALPANRIRRELSGENLDGDIAIKARVRARDKPRPCRPRLADKRSRRVQDGYQRSVPWCRELYPAETKADDNSILLRP